MPTIRRCCIVGCLSNSSQSPQLQFFQFPRPENPFYNLWKQACHASLSRILPFKKPVVCALHFHPNLIGVRRLRASAVPSQRLEVPNNYMKQYGEYDEDDEDSQGQSVKDQQQIHLAYDAYGQTQQNYNGSFKGYEGYYDRQNQHSNYSSPQPHRPASHSPPQQQVQKLESPIHRSSPVLQAPAKRARVDEDDVTEITNGHNIIDLTSDCEANDCDVKPIKLVNGSTTPNGTNDHTPAPSPKPTVNGSTNVISKSAETDLTSYAQALEYLKPLEEFALSMENFRAIGLISQLDIVLRKGENKRLAMNQ